MPKILEYRQIKKLYDGVVLYSPRKQMADILPFKFRTSFPVAIIDDRIFIYAEVVSEVDDTDRELYLRWLNDLLQKLGKSIIARYREGRYFLINPENG